MNIKKLAIIIYIIGIAIFSSGSVLEIRNEAALISSRNEYVKLFQDDSPKTDITVDDVNKVKNLVSKVSTYNKKEKDKMNDDLTDYQIYLNLKEEFKTKYDKKYINSSLTDEDITRYEKTLSKISNKYKKELNVYVNDMKKQKKSINKIISSINNLFTNADYSEIKELDKNKVEEIRIELNKLPQEDIKEKYNNILNDALTLIDIRIDHINRSWVRLNVHYISQNKNNVLNGCEAASLLMGLQYKGYLIETNLYDYATNMPKSTDPYQGFTYDIYGTYPTDVAHWIAPSPLAAYGRNSSGNQNIVDGTGYSLDELDKELDNGNPVVIYLTAMFKPLKEWKEGAPRNIHVMLLTGYNRATGEHIITDPWTHDDGRTSWTVGKDVIEPIYNEVGKKSVIIR